MGKVHNASRPRISQSTRHSTTNEMCDNIYNISQKKITYMWQARWCVCVSSIEMPNVREHGRWLDRRTCVYSYPCEFSALMYTRWSTEESMI